MDQDIVVIKEDTEEEKDDPLLLQEDGERNQVHLGFSKYSSCRPRPHVLFFFKKKKKTIAAPHRLKKYHTQGISFRKAMVHTNLLDYQTHKRLI